MASPVTNELRAAINRLWRLQNFSCSHEGDYILLSRFIALSTGFRGSPVPTDDSSDKEWVERMMMSVTSCSVTADQTLLTQEPLEVRLLSQASVDYSTTFILPLARVEPRDLYGNLLVRKLILTDFIESDGRVGLCVQSAEEFFRRSDFDEQVVRRAGDVPPILFASNFQREDFCVVRKAILHQVKKLLNRLFPRIPKRFQRTYFSGEDQPVLQKLLDFRCAARSAFLRRLSSSMVIIFARRFNLF